MAKTFLCRVDECAADGLKAFTAADGTQVLIVTVGAERYAYQAMCPHQAVPLAEGVCDGDVLTCLEHLWQWNVRTGEPRGDAEEPLQRYEITEEDGALYLLSPPSAG